MRITGRTMMEAGSVCMQDVALLPNRRSSGNLITVPTAPSFPAEAGGGAWSKRLSAV
jgi:hypothetical protein